MYLVHGLGGLGGFDGLGYLAGLIWLAAVVYLFTPAPRRVRAVPRSAHKFETQAPSESTHPGRLRHPAGQHVPDRGDYLAHRTGGLGGSTELGGRAGTMRLAAVASLFTHVTSLNRSHERSAHPRLTTVR